MSNFYLKDDELSVVELRRIIEIIARCTDLYEVYYETEEEDRPLLRKAVKVRFLPEED